MTARVVTTHRSHGSATTEAEYSAPAVPLGPVVNNVARNEPGMTARGACKLNFGRLRALGSELIAGAMILAAAWRRS